MNYKVASLDDVDLLIDLRIQQLIDEGSTYQPIESQLKEYFTSILQANNLYQIIVYDNEKAIACGGFIVYAFPPGYNNPSGLKAYICNVYTHKNYRRQGICKNILDKLCLEIKDRGIKKVWLNASTKGMPVYFKYGFVDNHEWLDFEIER